MALLGRIVASIYRTGVNDIPGGNMGRAYTFNSQQCLTYPAPAATVANGVTMNSIIELLPEGLVVDSKKYYTDSTSAQLVTNGS
jgi:hypothetical protein